MFKQIISVLKLIIGEIVIETIPEIMIEIIQVVIMIETVDINLVKINTNITGLDMIETNERENSIMITIMTDGRMTEMEIGIKEIGILIAMIVKEKDQVDGIKIRILETESS